MATTIKKHVTNTVSNEERSAGFLWGCWHKRVYLRQRSPRAPLHVVGMLWFMSLTLTNRARPFLFICSCVCFCLYPFNCISFHTFSPKLSAFSLFIPAVISAFLVLSTTYLCMKVSLSPNIILCGWLGLKLQLTNYVSNFVGANDEQINDRDDIEALDRDLTDQTLTWKSIGINI